MVRFSRVLFTLILSVLNPITDLQMANKWLVMLYYHLFKKPPPPPPPPRRRVIDELETALSSIDNVSDRLIVA